MLTDNRPGKIGIHASAFLNPADLTPLRKKSFDIMHQLSVVKELHPLEQE